ncbi:putative MFS family arabinose efflux permease [Microbacterium resistens]|uniref:MFS family arabinose efflux permease n=1 Tax=Microbacterium resistens TaxID=156977 RepID=A0ABU1SD82_9MICO|nr:putative MFS family arabinose efflux permease [Microbacterium resistens]
METLGWVISILALGVSIVALVIAIRGRRRG